MHQAKKEYKKAFQKYAKKRHESEKKNVLLVDCVQAADDSEIQEELATLETTVNRTKTTLMELWESVKRDRMAEVLQVRLFVYVYTTERAAKSLFTNFEAEYIMAREVCNNFTESSPSVLRCAQACGLKVFPIAQTCFFRSMSCIVYLSPCRNFDICSGYDLHSQSEFSACHYQEDISIPISTIGEPTNVEHLGGGGGVNILESDNRLDLRDANVTQQLQQDSIAYALPSSRSAPSPSSN
eukprot:747950-Hanusia_phi.AAC.3